LKHYWDFNKAGLTADAGDSKGYTKVDHTSLVTVPLAAKGEDSHYLTLECVCLESTTYKHVLVDALMRFSWEVAEGGGGFVQKPGEPGKPSEEGQQVIYQPPEMTKDYPDPGSIVDVRVRVMQEHSDPSKQPMHGPLVLGLHFKITRMAKDKYTYEFWPADPVEVTNILNLPLFTGDCTCTYAWQQGKPISGIVEGPRECFEGDNVRFEAKANDEDNLNMKCLPGVICKRPDQGNLLMSDTLNFDWSSNKGKFVKTPTKNAKQIVWEAPKDYEGVVDISVRIFDDKTNMEFNDEDLITGHRIVVKKKPKAEESTKKKDSKEEKEKLKQERKKAKTPAAAAPEAKK
jgi:hypothetical protein